MADVSYLVWVLIGCLLATYLLQPGIARQLTFLSLLVRFPHCLLVALSVSLVVDLVMEGMGSLFVSSQASKGVFKYNF